MWDEIVYLGIKVDDKVNEIGDSVETIDYSKEVFCNELSVRSSEFYQAQAVGLKPAIVLEIMLDDYNKEIFVKYQKEEFRVLRTYKKSKEKIELTLVRGID